jgi:broad specificity phosphatase PhoE
MIRLVLVLILMVAMPVQAVDIYLVRHAEKHTDGDQDPGLTRAGLDRAKHLAELLASAGIKRVFSSNYRRTRLTAAPLAVANNIDVEFYDPRDLEGFAESLKSLEENALVVGHSNTTPQLAAALGGDPGPEMDESIYDRVYLVQINGESVNTILFHLPPSSGTGE